MDELTINYGYCSNGNLACHLLLGAFFQWGPVVVGAYVAAYFSIRQFWKRQARKNRHILHALWEETRTVIFDCLQWIEAGSVGEIKKKVSRDPKYRPFTVNFVTSKRNIESLVSDMPGVTNDLARSGFRFHYRDAIALGYTDAVLAQSWFELSEEQKHAALDDLDTAMRELHAAGVQLHTQLSEFLKIDCDPDVRRNTVPAGFK